MTQTPQQLLAELEYGLKVKQELPHIAGFPWYGWAKEFYDCRSQAAFLCAANQVSKSSTQIRTAIEWATNPDLWPELWPGLLPGQKPNQFWYFYPTFEVWQTEFETKWEPDFLPRGDFKNDPITGWKEEYDKGQIKKINFNSGVTIYCKAYSQKVKDLQSGSVHAMFLDEECPAEYMPELLARLRAVAGYLRAVFTATLGQEFWRRVMEPKNKEEEIFPNAHKRSISLYDSQVYIDGKASRWTNARIAAVIAECETEADVQRRVFGRFVKSEGLKLESFDLERNTRKPQPIPQSWQIYGAVDPGSGGKSGHPSAMTWLAVRPDFKEGVIFRGWRGDGIPTANTDTLRKYRELRAGLRCVSEVYDYKEKDFQLEAESAGESFQPAKKQRDEGFGLLNSLFKTGMLKIERGDPELEKLIIEIQMLAANVDKRKAKDDLIDTVRYNSMEVPWDFSGAVVADPSKFADKPQDLRSDEEIERARILKARRDFVLNKESTVDDMEAEFEYLNDLSGAGND